VLELWQGTAVLLDACALVLAAQSATQLDVAQDSMAQAAATALSEPPFQSLPGAAEFVHDMCLFLGFLSPAALKAPAMTAALGMRLLCFAVRHGQVAAAQVLHACMGSTAGRKAMGAAGCGPVLSAQCQEQMARLARRSGVQGMSEAVKGWSVAAPAALVPGVGAVTAAAAGSGGKDSGGPPSTAGAGTKGASPRSLLLACLRGFPDARQECEYAEYFAAASRPWRLWWLLVFTVSSLSATCSFSLRSDEPLLQLPGLYISLIFAVMLLLSYRSSAGTDRGSSAGMHPWRPRAHDLVCVLIPALVSVNKYLSRLYNNPRALSLGVLIAERRFRFPADVLFTVAFATAIQTRLPWIFASTPLSVLYYFMIHPQRASAPGHALAHILMNITFGISLAAALDYSRRSAFLAALHRRAAAEQGQGVDTIDSAAANPAKL
jgi:hypothetical protein